MDVGSDELVWNTGVGDFWTKDALEGAAVPPESVGCGGGGGGGGFACPEIGFSAEFDAVCAGVARVALLTTSCSPQSKVESLRYSSLCLMTHSLHLAIANLDPRAQLADPGECSHQWGWWRLACTAISCPESSCRPGCTRQTAFHPSIAAHTVAALHPCCNCMAPRGWCRSSPRGTVLLLHSPWKAQVRWSMLYPTSTEVGEGANCYCGTRGTEPDSQQGFLIFLHYTHLMGRYNRQGRKAKNRRSWDSYSNRAYSRTQMLCAVKQLQNYDCRGVYSDT